MSIVDEMISHSQGETSYKVRVKSFKHKMNTWVNGRVIHLKSFHVDGVELKLEIYPNGEEESLKSHVAISIVNLSNLDISMVFDLSLGREEVQDVTQNFKKSGCRRLILACVNFFDHKKIQKRDTDEDLEITFTVKRLWKEITDDKVNLNIEQTRMDILEESMKSLMSKIETSSGKPPYPECPICLENMNHETRIMQCGLGHFLCQECFDRLDYSSCPTCSKAITGRCHGMETYLKTLFDNNNE